jgi:DNA repair protein RadD
VIPQLRPYQLAAVEQTKQRIASGFNRVCIVAPTGAGKTVIGSHMMREMVASGRDVLFLAHRRELIHQTVDKLASFNVPSGIIMAGQRPSEADLVQVASIQTLARRTLARRPRYIIIDECHHVTESNAYGRLIAEYPDSKILGLTATPFRLDGRGLADIFPAHVVTTTPSKLRDEGFLCPVTGWVFKSLDTSGVRTSGGDYNNADLAALPNTILGDVVGHWLERFGGNPVRTILFAASVAHSRQFVAQFRAAGVAAEHLDGETPAAERAAIIARVRSGATVILSNCNVATEGFDVPELTCCILARPTKSLCMYLQQVGRVLRPCTGKRFAIIHDHANCLVTHGTPYDESREYVPAKTARRRDTTPIESLSRCAQCGAVTDERPCPSCGYAVVRDQTLNPDLSATAVPLDEIVAEQTTLSDLRGSVSFKRINDAVVGDLLRSERTTGVYGAVNRYHFQGLNAPFFIDAGADLHPKLIVVPAGTRVRIVYRGTETTNRGFRKRLYSVFIPANLPLATSTQQEPTAHD